MKSLICEEQPDVFRKEWARRDLRGAAASAVRRIRSCSIKQVVGMEKRIRTYGLTAEETRAAIHEGMAGVTNPDPDKFKALSELFPK
jgi:hypothetical protein